MSGIDRVAAIIEEVRQEHAPDPRTSVYEIEVAEIGDVLMLHGATSEPAAAEALHRRVATLQGPRAVEDRVERLPKTRDGRAVHALVTAASAPMLAGAAVIDVHVSQVLLGHRLLVLRERGRWLHCRSTDGYLGWIHRGYIHRVDETEARAWEIADRGFACLSLGMELLGVDGEVMARLPWGARFVLGRDGLAHLPDGRTGSAVGDFAPTAELHERFPLRGDAVVETAARWIGAPYLWGGTTPAGVDCSGLAQATYRTHGVELPRDSDQQSVFGAPVDPGPDFANLIAGDLLFFAEDPGRVTHVTMSEGGSRIIHSSLGNGGVERNDLNGPLPFERELRTLFVRARRVILPVA